MTDGVDLDGVKKGMVGLISGFDSIEIIDDPTLTETNDSIAVLAAKMRDIIAMYGPEHVRQLTRMFMAHKTDYANPHKDTVADLTDGDIGEFFQRFLPGTPPTVPPDLVIDAFMEMGAPFSNTTVVRDSEMNVIDQQGYLSYCGPNEVGVDWSEGFPVIPCWPAVVEMIGNTDFSTNANFTLNGVTIVSSKDANLTPWMFGKQIAVLETAGQSAASISYLTQNTQTVGQVYTLSVFLFAPTRPIGTLYIDVDSVHCFIDINDPTNTFTGDDVQLVVKVLPNGWWRVGVTYVASQTSTAFEIGYDPNLYTSYASAVAGIALGNRVYIGAADRVAFTAFGPNVTDVPGLAPFIQSGSLASSVVSAPGPVGSIPLSQFIVAFRGILYGNTARTATDVVIDIDGNVVVNAQGTQLTTQVESITPAMPVVGSLNSGDTFHYALSSSPSKVSLLTSADTRKDITSFGSGAAYSNGTAFSSVSFGPFCGGIRSIQHYAVADDGHTLEYLTA